MKLYANVDIVNRRLASHGMKVNFKELYQLLSSIFIYVLIMFIGGISRFLFTIWKFDSICFTATEKLSIDTKKMNRFLGSREESEVVGFFVFSHIRMMDYFRLGLLNALLG